MRILICDDYVDTAESLADFCALYGHAADCAHGVVEAMTMLRGGSYDALVIDQCLPDGCGAHVIFAMRESPDMEKYRHAPAVMLTAVDAEYADTLSRVLARFPPAALLRKPADPEDLLARLEQLTESRG